MNDRQVLRKIAFLDTNTLHFIGIYLAHAKEGDLYPFREGEEVIITSRERLNQISEEGLKTSLKKGLETTIKLSETSSLIEYIEYAPVSELELLNGRIHGKAIESAAKEGIPDRMWRRFREKEIRERVSSTELANIKVKLDTLSSMLEESGIAVRANDKERVGDVLDLAKSISGLVYMETMDCIIYSSAIVAQADYLFTADNNLIEIVNRIHKSDDIEHEKIRLKLKELVSPITLIDREQVELPSAHTVTKEGNFKPDLSISQAGGSS